LGELVQVFDVNLLVVLVVGCVVFDLLKRCELGRCRYRRGCFNYKCHPDKYLWHKKKIIQTSTADGELKEADWNAIATKQLFGC
jgi:hypothetical protein